MNWHELEQEVAKLDLAVRGLTQVAENQQIQIDKLETTMDQRDAMDRDHATFSSSSSAPEENDEGEDHGD